MHIDPMSEWIETDGLGGFASGTVSGIRTRRYHALLLAATTPPTGRRVLVHGFDAWVETPNGRYALSSQLYGPDVRHPDGADRIEHFESEPWPRWTFVLGDSTRIEQQVCLRHGEPVVAVWWKVVQSGSGPVRLEVRPFLSGRDYHSMHHENGAFAFEPERLGQRLRWRPYTGVADILLLSNATYEQAPQWYRNFLYVEERNRGLDATEDLAAPGLLRWDLTQADAVMLIGAGGTSLETAEDAQVGLELLREAERARRAGFARPVLRAADAYVVRRGSGQSMVAGYPWFTDWGRDTFIAIRGLCLATGRLDEALAMLLEWSGAVSQGMLPNRFPDAGELPEYNSVDASLWYVVAVHELLVALGERQQQLEPEHERRLQQAVQAILEGYAAGTRFGIRADHDGLLAAGEPGWQLTWMDAKVGDQVITPRIGKPVETQALWLNALWIAGKTSLGGATASRWLELYERGRVSFGARFWNATRGCLYDVVDVDHEAGRVDATVRPNQIFAVGGLPQVLLPTERARSVVDTVESKLWTPLGLRSLAPDEPGYVRHYRGGVWERDSAYHQGTVWPWLAGPFVEAWVRVRGDSLEIRRLARQRFLASLQEHLQTAGIGHISEIADAEPPHTPRGCPFQAWSLGELLRLDCLVLAATPQPMAPITR